MRRYTPGTFRATTTDGGAVIDNIPINCGDIAGLQLPGTGAPVCAYTAGATLIDPLTIGGPSQSQGWSLLSLSVELNLRISQVSNGVLSATNAFGRLGRILAGIILDTGAITQGLNGAPYLATLEQLPPDVTLLSTIWDPDSDALPPTNSTNVLTCTTSIIPSGGPIQMTGAETPLVGIWMEPSIIGVTGPADEQYYQSGLVVSDATWAMSFDDGL